MSELAARPIAERGATVVYRDRHGRIQRGDILKIEAYWHGWSKAGKAPLIIYDVRHPTYHNHHASITAEDMLTEPLDARR